MNKVSKAQDPEEDQIVKNETSLAPWLQRPKMKLQRYVLALQVQLIQLIFIRQLQILDAFTSWIFL